MSRADHCTCCGEHAITIEVPEGRACVRCLRTYYAGNELRRLLDDDDAREDERARAAGLMDCQGYIVISREIV